MLSRHVASLVALTLCGLAGFAVWHWLDDQQADPGAPQVAGSGAVGSASVMGTELAGVGSGERLTGGMTEGGLVDQVDDANRHVVSGSVAPVSTGTRNAAFDKLFSGEAGDVLQLLLAASREDLDALFLRGEGRLHDTLLDMISAEVGQDEAEFLMRLLSNLTDWPDVRARILERELQTGQDYRELMLTLGLSSGQIAVEDLLAFVDTGLSMPEGALHLLALHGRAEDIASLALRAPFPDLNARNPVTGNTAVGALIQHYGMTPNPDPAAAVAALRSLVELGIDTRQADGELDLLSMIFLHTRPWNQWAMGAMAGYVVQSGIVTEPEQMTLWNLIDTPADQENLRQAFDQYR